MGYAVEILQQNTKKCSFRKGEVTWKILGWNIKLIFLKKQIN